MIAIRLTVEADYFENCLSSDWISTIWRLWYEFFKHNGFCDRVYQRLFLYV